jgi:hypothetical protein
MAARLHTPGRPHSGSLRSMQPWPLPVRSSGPSTSNDQRTSPELALGTDCQLHEMGVERRRQGYRRGGGRGFRDERITWRAYGSHAAPGQELPGSLGALPEKLVWDGEGAIHSGGGRPTEQFACFCGQLAVGWIILDSGDAEAKGLLERSHRFLRSSFEPGRRFANELDYRAQLDGWTDGANSRTHRTTRAVPAERLAEERQRMRPLPGGRPRDGWPLRLARAPAALSALRPKPLAAAGDRQSRGLQGSTSGRCLTRTGDLLLVRQALYQLS